MSPYIALAIISYWPLHIIKFEHPSRSRATADEAGFSRPAKPVLYECCQPRQTLLSTHCRNDDILMGNIYHPLQECYINIFFRLEMGEETALGHANMIGQYTDGYAGKTGSAQKAQ